MTKDSWPIAEQLIASMLDQAEQLRLQLNQEAEILKSGAQPHLMDQCTAAKKILAVQLDQLNRQFSQLLVSQKLPDNQDGVNAYLRQAEVLGFPTGDATSQWEKVRQVCAECKDLNEHNGACIDLLSLHAKRSLDILKGKTGNSNTYGKDGISKSDALTHTLTFYL